MRAESLTAIAGKSEIYARDPWFQLGVGSVAGRLDEDRLWSLGTLIAKPESVYARRLEAMLDYLAQHRFEVVAARAIEFDLPVVREMWKNHWRAATDDRRSLAADLLSSGESLFLVVLDRAPRDRIPAAVRLSALKGPTLAEHRQPGQLRTALGAPGRMINFVHTADDPADVVRELALLFASPARKALVEELAEPAPRMPLELVTALYARHPERSLDEVRAQEAMRESLEAVSDPSRSERAAEALEILDVDRRWPGSLPWRELRGRLLEARPDLDLWNPVVYASERIAHDRPGVSSDMPDGAEEDWLRRGT